jgi:hypothetical protein
MTNPIPSSPPVEPEGSGECAARTALSSLRDGTTLRCFHPSGFNHISQRRRP